jgi:hypothetical protein
MPSNSSFASNLGSNELKSCSLIVVLKRNGPTTTSAEKRQGGRAHDVVEQESSVHEQNEAKNLEPLKCLPPKAERDDPDEKRPASVDGTARRG